MIALRTIIVGTGTMGRTIILVLLDIRSTVVGVVGDFRVKILVGSVSIWEIILYIAMGDGPLCGYWAWLLSGFLLGLSSSTSLTGIKNRNISLGLNINIRI